MAWIAVVPVATGALLALSIRRPAPNPAEEKPIPAGESARDSLAALDAAIGQHISKSRALWDAAHWVLIDAQDGGAPTREHLRALWEAYMAFRLPEVLAANGGGHDPAQADSTKGDG